MSSEKIIKYCDYIIHSGLLAIVFFIPLIFDIFGETYNVIDLYKAVFFRLVLTIVLLSYVAKIFISGRLKYPGEKKIFIFSALLILSFFLSSLYSLHPNDSLWGGFFRGQGFYNFFNYLLFFFLLILNIRDSKEIRRLIFTIIASASLTAVYGLIQYLNLDPYRWNESAFRLGRVFSSLGQPNFFAHYLILVLPFSFYSLFFLAKNFLSKFFIILSVLLQLGCLILTYSRAAWLSFMGMLVFLALSWLILKGHKKIAWAFSGLLLAGLIIVVGINIMKPINQESRYYITPLNRLKSIVNFKDGSSIMRIYFFKAGFKEMAQAAPLRLALGYGPETLTSVFIKYYAPEWGIYENVNTLPDRAHNWLFDGLLSLGFFGLSASLLFYVYFILKIKKYFAAGAWTEPDFWLVILLSSSLIGYLINNLLSFSSFTNSVYLFLILGIIWLIINNKDSREIKAPLRAGSKFIIWLGLALVAAVFIYTNNINQVRAERHYITAIKSLNRSDCRSVIDNMEQALRLAPNNHYYQENYLAFTLNCLLSVKDKTAREIIKNNILAHIDSFKDKEFYDLKINLGRAYSLFGSYFDKSYYQEAEAIFERLITAYPFLTTAYEELARGKSMKEDNEQVVTILRQAITVLPSLDHPSLNESHRRSLEAVLTRFYEKIGNAYVKMKKYDQARSYFNKSLKLNLFQPLIYKNLADTYYLEGRLAEAIELNQRGFMLYPNDYHWPLSLSLLYREQKDLEKAKIYLDQAIKLEPENLELNK